MTWQEEAAACFPDSPYLIKVQGSVFERMMGPDWVRKNPDILLFITAEDAKAIGSGAGLATARVRASMERFLSHPRALKPCSAEEEALKTAYRAIFLCGDPEFWQKIEGRIGAAIAEPVTLACLTVLSLSLWPADPRKDARAARMWFFAGYAYVQLGNAETAADLLEQSLELNPDSIPALNELANLRLQAGRREEGRTLLKRVLAIEPENVLATCNTAALHIEMGEPEEARPLIAKALLLAPEDPQAKQLAALLPKPLN